MKKLLLKNNFHNTQVMLRVKHDGVLERGTNFELSIGQVKKAHRELCAAGCICSGVTGARALYHEVNGNAVRLGFETHENARTGQLEGVTVWVEEVAPW